MKSTVNNVIAMTAAVACLGLLLSRPAGADDGEKGEKEVKKEAHVVVVRAEGETDISEAIQKVLQLIAETKNLIGIIKYQLTRIR